MYRIVWVPINIEQLFFKKNQIQKGYYGNVEKSDLSIEDNTNR